MDNPFGPEVLVESVGAVRLVTLNRPEALNSANEALHRGITGIWRIIAADPEARAVVITGAGRAFSAGGDLHHLHDLAADVPKRRQEIQHAADLVHEMTAFALPVVAAVNGAAVGLGCNIAALSDIVLMADSAYLADPHVSIGLTAADGGAPAWPMFMSLLRAKEYLFTGDRIPADVAVQLGLANRVVPAAELQEAALRLATRLAEQPAHALQSTKRALNLHLERAIHGVLEYALAEEYKSFDDPQHQAIIKAFLDKQRTGSG
ncbi:MAG: putative Enoyl-CoA hydratase [Mycobacterium sp.]|jgi:enoyl-CoA hydratase|nr:putative Enoyl-CoA hydratase [Mycobacterium sp.]